MKKLDIYTRNVQGASQLSKIKNALVEAYIQLLQHSAPNQITVKQIVEKAFVSRASFYTYYINREQLHQHVKELLYQKFLTFYILENELSHPNNIVLQLCQHILKYRAYYQYAFRDTNEIQLMSNELSKRLITVYNDRDYAIFASYGTIGYLKNWVEEGFLQSPIEVSEKLLKIGFTDWTRDLPK